jgi:hypothetical protein
MGSFPSFLSRNLEEGAAHVRCYKKQIGHLAGMSLVGGTVNRDRLDVLQLVAGDDQRQKLPLHTMPPLCGKLASPALPSCTPARISSS